MVNIYQNFLDNPHYPPFPWLNFVQTNRQIPKKTSKKNNRSVVARRPPKNGPRNHWKWGNFHRYPQVTSDGWKKKQQKLNYFSTGKKSWGINPSLGQLLAIHRSNESVQMSTKLVECQRKDWNCIHISDAIYMLHVLIWKMKSCTELSVFEHRQIRSFCGSNINPWDFMFNHCYPNISQHNTRWSKYYPCVFLENSGSYTIYVINTVPVCKFEYTYTN